MNEMKKEEGLMIQDDDDETQFYEEVDSSIQQNNIKQNENYMLSKIHLDNDSNKNDRSKMMKPQMYVVIYNISKKKNIGSIIRSCVAFNVHTIYVIGRNKKKEVNYFGNMGTFKYANIEYFSSINELKIYLKEKGILLYGVEIGRDAIPVTSKPFKQDTAFLFGNEGTGIDDQVLNLCDEIIYIPQYGNGTSSLNVSVSCAIILHNYAVWANYEETKIDNKKFVIEKCKSKLENYLCPTEMLQKEIELKRIQRSEKNNEKGIISLDEIF